MSIDSVLGINRRNIDYILALNKREHFVYVDDKLVTKSMLDRHGIPSARLLGSTDSFFGIDSFFDLLMHHRRFALKPARGSGGSGIAIVKDCPAGYWILADGSKWDREKQREHVQAILYGTFSLDTSGDVAFAESLIETHPDLLAFTEIGLPDVRIILHSGTPILSMLRVPTRKSSGKANLHSGGFAVGIDLKTGITGAGWYRGKEITRHPETGAPLQKRAIPFWNHLLGISARLFELFPLGYMGVDFAIDAHDGPLILELNARPGLEIQNVTGCGLRSILEGNAHE
jgi:alpha-L-glutamate ligase-like protein